MANGIFSMRHDDSLQDAHNIQHLHDETLMLSIHDHLQLHAHITNRNHNIHHTPYTNIQHTSTLQG